ncbi:LysR family transcriptional regulator [Jiangella ureilytica]|uniref:LysR family transcriptional regulator n=1 Tax=Jiangella ureilytica TaxID=2530374 RepID=A0A4R4RHF9_9ACTN|nr:alpha/beta hydrolase fold domain-containing protein [Jiangella ureilytica]TDC48790.1 LysR family transcriptional regulator [Jiangella ureilytica]
MDNEPRGRLIELPHAPEAIELRHLRAFVAVAQELNFSRAAERLYLSQPALSRQISSLEKLLRVDLLRRTTQRVELTLAGEALLDRVKTVLADLDDAVQVTRSVGGETYERVERLLRPLAESVDDLDAFRAANEQLSAQFPTPAGIEMRPVTAGGVPSLAFGRDHGELPSILHVHGGGYVVGSAYGYRPLAGALAVAASATVLVPDYRLAPEHPFPAAADDVVAAYTWLAERHDPAALTLCGDSTGGGLAMSALLRLRADGAPLPGRVVLLSPGVDLTCRVVRDHSEPQPMGIVDLTERFAGIYLDGHPADDPLVNPLYADLAGLPPLLVQAATGEPALPECRALVDRATAAGVDARLELYPVSTHVFHLYWSFLPEAAEALERAAEFIAASTAEARADPAARSAG